MSDVNRRLYAGEKCPNCRAPKLVERPPFGGEAWCYGCGIVVPAGLQELEALREIWADFRAHQVVKT